MPIPPLLFIPFIAYNLMALGLMTRGGMGWDAPLVSLPLPSSETFRFTLVTDVGAALAPLRPPYMLERRMLERRAYSVTRTHPCGARRSCGRKRPL